MSRINCHNPLEDGKIKVSTLLLLAHLIEKTYPDKWQYAVEVCPKCIIKTIDNQADVIITIANILELSSIEVAEISMSLEDNLSNIINEHIVNVLPVENDKIDDSK